jgi:uncharacterized protein YbaR (Trm112 family)/ubiquinone/menaquinone biosynthesis C-methylase UbiE
MKYRVLDWLVCPVCGKPGPSISVTKETKIPDPNQFSQCEHWCGRHARVIDSGVRLRFELPDFSLVKGWAVWKDNPDFVINQREQAIAEQEFAVPEGGTYRVSLLGIPGNKVSVTIDGKQVGEVSSWTDSLRFRPLLGDVNLKEGRHHMSILDEGGEKVSYVGSVFLEKPPLNSGADLSECGLCRSLEVEEALIICECGREFPVNEGFPFLLPDACREPKQDDSEDDNDPDRYKKAEMAISDNSLSEAFFAAQSDLPFRPILPSQTIDYISRFMTATSLLDCGVGATVLDNAVGTAWTSEWLVRMGYEVIGTEICVDYFKSGRRRMGQDFMTAKPLHLIVCDAENLPLREEIADGILSFDSFHHMLDRSAVVSRFDNVLKAGGSAVFVEPGETHEDHPASVWVNKRYGILERGVTSEELQSYAENSSFVRPSKHTFDCHNNDILVLRKKGIKEHTSRHPHAVRALLAVAPQQTRQENKPDVDQVISALNAVGKIRYSLHHEGIQGFTARLFRYIRRRFTGTDVEESPRQPQGPLSKKVKAGQPVQITLTAKNTGDTCWLARSATGRGRVVGVADLFTVNAELIAERFVVADLQRDITPGESAELVFEFNGPEKGEYILQFDMCVEGMLHFKAYEFNPLDMRMQVI